MVIIERDSIEVAKTEKVSNAWQSITIYYYNTIEYKLLPNLNVKFHP
jgi:hypothetical protein